MRMSERNKQTVYYANYSARADFVDEYGNSTSEAVVTYSNPIKTAWNMNTVSSDIEVAMFGIKAIDTIVFIVPRKSNPVDEASVLWYGVTPTLAQDGSTNTPYNYRIVGIRTSLNYTKVYAQKVHVTNPPLPEPEPPIDPTKEPPEEGEDE